MSQSRPHSARRRSLSFWFTEWARRLLGIILLFMVALNLANAMGRYVAGWAIPGSDEVLVFAMVWLVFLGAVLVTARQEHLGFPALVQRLDGRARDILGAVIALGMALLAAVVATQSWGVVSQLNRIGQKSMAAEIPMTVPHAAVLVSFALIAVIALLQGLSKLYAWRRGRGRQV